MNKIINYLAQFISNDQTNFPGLFKKADQPRNLELTILQANHGVLFDLEDGSWTVDWKRI